MGMASYLVVSSFFFNLVWMSAQRLRQAKAASLWWVESWQRGITAKQQRREEENGEMRDSPRWSHGEGGSAS